jgi:hypothetical protein
LRGIPHVLNAAARGIQVFRAQAASFTGSVDHCALILLHVSIMISNGYYQIFRPNSTIKIKKKTKEE